MAAPEKPLRIAFFGGSFDPPHRGHVALARAAADRFALNTVFFAPAGRQPLKQASAAASFADRLTLCALTCVEDPRFAVSNLDAPRPDGSPSYTVRTLELLGKLMPQAILFSLAGADSFATLGHWREPQRLLALAEWIVVSRPGYPLADPEGLTLTPAQRTRIHQLNTVHEEVAATTLRHRLQTGQPCHKFLPAAVEQYIRDHALYRSDESKLKAHSSQA